MLKKGNTSPLAKLCDRNSEIHDILAVEISTIEARKDILRQKDNKDTGNDYIATEIFKQNIEIRTNPIKSLIQDVSNKEMPNDWKQGVITRIRKAGCAERI